jgi:hypothetical protein
MGISGSRSDILPETRLVAAVIIPFLAIAVVVLVGAPTETKTMFAWEIKPPLAAMWLGAAYAGGIWFFVRVLRASRWEQVKVGFPAIVTFASILGAATIVHWDRFTHGSLPFIVWATLYFTTPVVVLRVWLRQRSAVPSVPIASGMFLPATVRWVLGALGLGEIAIALLLIAAPGAIMAAWPWTLTLLTGWVIAAMFALTGVVGLGMAIDGRWTAARFVLEAEVVSIALMLIAVLRDQADYHMAPFGLLFFGGLTILVVAIGAVYAWSIREDTRDTAMPAS